MRGARVSPITIVSKIRDVNPKLQCGSDEWMAYALILGSASYGPDERRIAKNLGISAERLTWMADNLRRNQIWTEGKLSLHPDDFVFAACCALGLMDKVQPPEVVA